MSIFSKLFESSNKNSNSSDTSNKHIDIERSLYRDSLYSNHILNMNQYNVWELISLLRNLNDGYKYKYAEYQAMADETIVQSALELYADDATQVDTSTGRSVHIISDDRVLQDDLIAFLDSLNINTHIWNWAFNIAQYGDMYLELYYDDNTGKISIDDIIDPALIMDLYEKGNRVAYAQDDTDANNIRLKNKSNPNGLSLILYNKYKFVHFMINMSSKYDTLEIPELDKVDDQGDTLVRKFTVVRGVSMIEGVRSIYRILALLEDTLLAARIAKAEYIRIFNIEVGNSTPSMTTQIVNSVKNLFDSKASFDTNSGRYTSTKTYRPIGDPIFNPTREGKGTVSHESIGGDFQVKDIVDIDYFKDKLFAGLKIPKAYLGYEESLPGGLGDSTLTKLDIRYSRSVKRIQAALIQGITDLCNTWLVVNNRNNDIDKFKVTMVPPSNAEELGRLTEVSMKVDTISTMANSISSVLGDSVPPAKIYKILFDQYIGNPDLSGKIDEELDKAIESELDKKKLAKMTSTNSKEDEEPESSYLDPLLVDDKDNNKGDDL